MTIIRPKLCVMALCLVLGGITPGWSLEAQWMTDHPLLQGGDQRAHLPRIMEKLGPMMETVAETLRTSPDPPTVLRVTPLIQEMAAEMKEMYLLSMSVRQTTDEADQLLKRVMETERKVKELKPPR